MIQKTQVPEKGLLEVLLGGKGDAAQAGNPAGSGVDAASESPEDFSAALIQAQDQKDAKTASQARSAKAKAAALRTKGEAGVKKTAEETQEQGRIQGKKQVQTPAQVQAQAAAQAAALAAAQAQAGALAEAQSQTGVQDGVPTT